MKRRRTALKGTLLAMATLAAGCAHHGETGTSAYVWGTIFIIIGLGLAVALVMGMD